MNWIGLDELDVVDVVDVLHVLDVWMRLGVLSRYDKSCSAIELLRHDLRKATLTSTDTIKIRNNKFIPNLKDEGLKIVRS